MQEHWQMNLAVAIIACCSFSNGRIFEAGTDFCLHILNKLIISSSRKLMRQKKKSLCADKFVQWKTALRDTKNPRKYRKCSKT